LERELVVRAQAGDTDAFATLARGIVDRLHGVAYRILRDADRADDATQRALIATWDHLRELRDPGRFDAWTYRLVVNEAYREARRERSQHANVRFIRVAEATDDQSGAIADRDELERAFRRLPPDQRAVLVLHHYADLPLAEIAEIMAVPVGTVGSRLHHATRRMRAALEADATRVLARGQAV
jgi:RNA polymerase sigma-70 factor (ECF subfamily)